ncbi:MAG: GNAT family N-acetyltransferase [Chloroflexi bacterium]|nr:GNAT family N-acetyltransferase [Chloroflexota bacterium]
MPVTIYRDPSAFDALASEWNTLVDQNPALPPFMRREWLSLWWRIVGIGELFLVAAREDSGRAIGIAPLYVDPSDGRRVVRNVGYGTPFYMDISDYLDFIIAPGREAEVYAAMLEALCGPDAPDWDRIELCNLAEWSPLLTGFEAQATQRGLKIEKSPLSTCPALQLPDSFDAYLESLDAKQRREIKRKMRRAGGETEVTWYIVGPERDIEAEAGAFIEMMSISGKGKHDFLIPQMREMFLEGMKMAQANGWLQLAFLEVNGRKAAAYLNFDYHGRVWVFNSAIDAEASGGISTGWVLLANLIQWAIENKREYYDFLRGDEEYKLQFGGKPTSIYKMTVRRAGE